MQIVKIILIVVDLIICVALTILAMIQSKEDAGLSSTITGSSSNNFFEKNKGRTKEGSLKKWTIIFGIIFAILTIGLGIVYVIQYIKYNIFTWSLQARREIILK